MVQFKIEHWIWVIKIAEKYFSSETRSNTRLKYQMLQEKMSPSSEKFILPFPVLLMEKLCFFHRSAGFSFWKTVFCLNFFQKTFSTPCCCIFLDKFNILLYKLPSHHCTLFHVQTIVSNNNPFWSGSLKKVCIIVWFICKDSFGKSENI